MPGASHRVAICPGSYDPPTNGHLDVIRRASTLFDVVVAAVVRNHSKATLFDVDERAGLVAACLSADEATAAVRVDVVPDGLLVDFARGVGAVAIVKGLRSGTDFAYELPMSRMNRHLTGIETVFLPADPAFDHISSSMIKEVARLGGDVSALVPGAVLLALSQRFGADHAP